MVGRPAKEKSFANMLNIALKEADGTTLDGQANTKLRQIATTLVEKAIAGEGWAIKEIADRTDGKPFQQIELSGDEENPINVRHIVLTALTAKADE